MSARRCGDSRAHAVVTGVMFLVSGVVLWAGARGWYSFEQSWAWWPLGFLFPAAHKLTAASPERSVLGGLAWLALAAVLIAANLGHVHLRLADTLALALVAAGARLSYLAWTRRRIS